MARRLLRSSGMHQPALWSGSPIGRIYASGVRFWALLMSQHVRKWLAGSPPSSARWATSKMSVGLATADILPFSRAPNPAFIRAELSPFALVLLASAGIRLVWWSFSLPPFVMPDSVGYFVPGFVLVDSGQLQLDLRRTPGYPLFAAGTLAVFGRDSLYPLLAVQQAIGWSTAGLTYVLGRLLFGRPTALLAGLLIGLDGALLLSEQLIMTETLFAFWLILSCVLLVLGVKYQQPVLLNLSGLALGVLTLVRPTGHVLVLSPLLACLLANRPRGWLNAALVVGGFALIVTPWTARNWVQFGTPSIAGSGRFLMERGLKYDDVFLAWAASGKITEGDPLRRAAIAICSKKTVNGGLLGQRGACAASSA
jgi:hypothetical protein